MEDYITYIIAVGSLIVIAGLVFLLKSKGGILLKKIKFKDTELEFENIQNKEIPKESDTDKRLNESIILFSDLSLGDCKKLNIESQNIKDFLLNDYQKHKDIYVDTFKSITISYSNYILILSWDLDNLHIERVVNREEAYPNLDSWIKCLTLYRKTINLPYRKNHNVLFNKLSSDSTIGVFKNLLNSVNKYQGEINKTFSLRDELEAYLETSETAFESGNIKLAVSNLEIALSNIHKFLIENLPPEISSKDHISTIQIEKTSNNKRYNILVIDDALMELQHYSSIIEPELGNIVSLYLTHSSEEALRVLFEKDFDLVITDMRLFPTEGSRELDGGEIAIKAKTINPNTKVIISTAYMGSTSMFKDLIQYTDYFLSKIDVNPEKLVGIIKELLNINE